MSDTLSPPFPLCVTALPTAVPASGPPADFLAPLSVTFALLAWQGLVLAPSAVPTACQLLAPPAPIGQGPPGPASTDPDAVPPGSAAPLVHPGPVLALGFQSVPPNWL